MEELVMVEVTPEITVLFKDEAVRDFIQADEEIWEGLVGELQDIMAEEDLETITATVTYDDDVAEWYVDEWH